METLDIKTISVRQKQIVREYLAQVEKHLEELKKGITERALEINEFADLMHMHPGHLSNTIHQVLGKSPCDIYEEKLTDVAKDLLSKTDLPIAAIAHQLTYDPSNFTKFFKKFTGLTPSQFRRENHQF